MMAAHAAPLEEEVKEKGEAVTSLNIKAMPHERLSVSFITCHRWYLYQTVHWQQVPASLKMKSSNHPFWIQWNLSALKTIEQKLTAPGPKMVLPFPPRRTIRSSNLT